LTKDLTSDFAIGLTNGFSSNKKELRRDIIIVEA
jgi:hypothetical protein